ncbi:MAG TPA: GNAT family N-acetyltransferase [Rhodanobacteraceae bacterium]|nr:GNAT family N-acetyltransferase [Rhodanobacteraceae bacterium]
MSAEIAEQPTPAAHFGPVLETARLILRVPRAEDFERYAEMLADEEAARHIGGQLARPPAWRRFLQMPGAWAIQGFAMFSVIEKSSGKWLGQAGPWRPEGWPGNEVGWSFHPDAWGHGYATEAAIAAMDWAFAKLGWDSVIHCIDPANLSSQRLAQRLSSRNKGAVKMPHPYEDLATDMWGQTREEWSANRRRLGAS